MLKRLGLLGAALAILAISVTAASSATRPVATGSPAAQAACNAAQAAGDVPFLDEANLIHATTASAARIAALAAPQIGPSVGGAWWNDLPAPAMVTVCVYSGLFKTPSPPGSRKGQNRLVVLIPPDGPAMPFQVGWDDNLPNGAALP
jgi:hypothetical protein